MNLTKNDLLACHRLANSGRAIIKVLNRKHAEKIMKSKSKLKGMYFSDILSIVEASVNSTQNRRNLRIYINYTLCLYYQFLYGKVKEVIQEGLIHNFWFSNGGIIKFRESTSLAPFSVSHENDLLLEC